MKKRLLQAAFYILILGLNSCDTGNTTSENSVTPPTSNAFIQTDKEIYTPVITPSTAYFDLEATYKNKQDKAIYVATCGDDLPLHKWEKYNGKTWEKTDAIVEYGCASELKSDEIVPGGKFVKEFYVSFDLPYDVEGFYRLNWLGVTENSDVNLSENYRISNAFEVKLP